MHHTLEKIHISQRNINRILFGTKTIWQVLKLEGFTLIDEYGLVNEKHARSTPVGIYMPDLDTRFYSDWSYTFVFAGKRAREIKVKGLPQIVVETPEMKVARCGAKRIVKL